MLFLIPIAFISGILTVFSPCVLPILPIILASGIDGKISRIRGIIAGLIVSFTIASLLLATIVQALGISADSIRNFAVGLLVIFGLSMLFPVIWEKMQLFLERNWKIQPVKSKNNGFAGGFITGVSLGIVWTPCVGPIVASVATLAAVNSFSPATVAIAFAYALGTGIPLYFIAKGGRKAVAKLGVFKQNSTTIRQVFGVIILATAVFIFSGVDRKLQAWTLANLPESWTQLATNFEKKANIEKSLQELKNTPKLIGKSGEVVNKNVSLQNDFANAKVKQEDLLQGCLGGKDCIPSIDNPKFESAKQAAWLSDNDTIFVLDYKGVQRAYPQRIMNWHEIVNDVISGDPIAITFCPLCGSALAFERKVDGVITELGVSGKLHNSDLVMYDRYEGNLWQQITGEAIVGPGARRDEILKQVPISTARWGEWKKEHPGTQVLSKNTGHIRDYEAYPYGTYEQDDDLYFGVKNLDRKLQIKTVIYGIEVNGVAKAYPESAFTKKSEISDTVGGAELILKKTDDGKIEVVNLSSKNKIIPIRLFWFAWASFHPNTELYQR